MNLLASVVLDRAADQIAKAGLWKGSFRDDDTDPTKCSYCLVGAIRYGSGWYTTYDRVDEAFRAAGAYVVGLLSAEFIEDLYAWSDAPTTTAEMVVDVLRHAASVARLDETAAA